MRRISVVLALFGVVACTNPEAPGSVVGTYSLASCGIGSGRTPPPCTLALGSDSLRVQAAVLTVKSDSTWTGLWTESVWSSGAWAIDSTYTMWGAYVAVPGNYSTYLFGSPPSGDSPVVVVIQGHRLEWGSLWTFVR